MSETREGLREMEDKVRRIIAVERRSEQLGCGMYLLPKSADAIEEMADTLARLTAEREPDSAHLRLASALAEMEPVPTPEAARLAGALEELRQEYWEYMAGKELDDLLAAARLLRTLGAPAGER